MQLGAFTVIFILSMHQPVKGQYKILPENEVWVTKMNSSPTIRGYISWVGDSSLTVVNKTNLTLTHEIPIHTIEILKFRKRNKIRKSFFRGALIGAAVGAIVGIAARHDNSCEPNTFCIGIPKYYIVANLMGGGAVIGGLAGLVIGHTISFKIPINGNKSSYNKQKEKLENQRFLYHIKS